MRPRYVLPASYIVWWKRSFLRFLVFCLSILLLLIPYHLTLHKPEGRSYVAGANIKILFDVSLSMLATDFLPNRFAVGREMLRELVDAAAGSAVSLTIYSGLPFTIIPFSYDHDLIIAQIDQFRMWAFPYTINFVGTAIGDALLVWFDVLQRQLTVDTHPRPWLIVLITDGDNNTWTNPYDLIDVAQRQRIPIYTAQIWADAEVIGIRHDGRSEYATVDPMLLSILSERTGAWSYILWDERDVVRFVADMRTVFDRYQEPRHLPRTFSLNTVFVPLAFIILLLLLAVRFPSLMHLLQRVRLMRR